MTNFNYISFQSGIKVHMRYNTSIQCRHKRRYCSLQKSFRRSKKLIRRFQNLVPSLVPYHTCACIHRTCITLYNLEAKLIGAVASRCICSWCAVAGGVSGYAVGCCCRVGDVGWLVAYCDHWGGVDCCRVCWGSVWSWGGVGWCRVWWGSVCSWVRVGWCRVWWGSVRSWCRVYWGSIWSWYRVGWCRVGWCRVGWGSVWSWCRVGWGSVWSWCRVGHD